MAPTDKEDLIRTLELAPHIEGGYFRQTKKASDTINLAGKGRALYTSIYFLLEETNPSHFHRLTADEIWYFHAGSPLTVHMITADGHYEAVTLGLDISKGQQLHYCVPKGTIWGSTVDKDDALVSCLVVTLTSLVYHRFLKFFIQILNSHRNVLNCKNYIRLPAKLES
ncbi:Uncharacterized conserved protein [Streptococcus pneumoniae]|nr:Uncharacterized conserved protein [Streptococcus pneumoniae]